jgi:hypothetical protein
MPPDLGQAVPRMNIPASLFSWPDQQRRLALSTYDLIEIYFIIFGHLARGSTAQWSHQVIIVRVLLVKIVENKEAQIIPIRGITIVPLIIKIYLTYT